MPGRHLVTQRDAPDLRLLRVVASHQRAGDRRGLARVLVAAELDRAARFGIVVGERPPSSRRRAQLRIGCRRGCEPLLAVPARHFQHGEDRVARDADARRIVLPGMRLDQHAEAVARRPVLLREALGGDADREARGRIVVAHERGIEIERQRALRGDSSHQLVAHRDGRARAAPRRRRTSARCCTTRRARTCAPSVTCRST